MYIYSSKTTIADSLSNNNKLNTFGDHNHDKIHMYAKYTSKYIRANQRKYSYQNYNTSKLSTLLQGGGEVTNYV
jgi:hypothetical protein